MNTDTFTIDQLCQYCKQTTKQLVNTRRTSDQTWSQGRYLSICSECGHLNSISTEGMEKYADTKRPIDTFEASAIYKKWNKLKESNEYKIWQQKISEETKEMARKFIEAGTNPKQDDPSTQTLDYHPMTDNLRAHGKSVPVPETVRNMGYNLLWYVPVCLWISIAFIIPNITSGFSNVMSILPDFWKVLFTFSAPVFFGAVLGSIFMPIQLLTLIPRLFEKGGAFDYKKRYLYTVLLVLAIIIGSILLQWVIMGSFPLVVDKNGYERIRMIPFIPLFWFGG